MAIIQLTAENFEQEVMQSNKPVLIDFWAEWCGYCKVLAPVLEEIAGETDQVKICKVNTDEEGELAEKFKVRSLPTLICIKDGKVVHTELGAQPKAVILKMIQ